MLKAMEDISIKPISWLKAGTYALCLTGIYYTALGWMILHDWAKEDYSHCMLVPFIVIYLLWEKRREIACIPSATSWIGFVPFGIGIVLFWLGELGGEYFTLYMSFWFAIIGLLWIHLGWEKVKTMWFALVFMLAMFPFPHFINTRIAFQLRLISSKLGVWMLHLYGMSAYREGNVIDLGFTQLQVVDACSGLRYVMPLMVLSLLLAHWFKAHLWKRTVLFLSSIPLAIFVNSFRIAATGVLYSFFGAQVAEGFFHDFSGWVIFMFTIPLLLLEMWVLKWFPPKQPGRSKTEEHKANPAHEGETVVGKSGNRTNAGVAGALMQPMFLAVMTVLILTFVLSHSIEFRREVPIAKPFGQFPMQIGEWQGTREDMEQEFLDTLKFSDYIIVNYKNKEGKTVNFYVAYYKNQLKGESIHSPETCLPAGGWLFKEAGPVVIPLGKGTSSVTINKSFMEKTGEKDLVYYWFPMRGRILTKLYQIKLYNFWDSLIRQRTDGALVRIITPVYPAEKPEEPEERLKEFLQKVAPVLEEYIPN